jgi:hypothetical protein
LGGLEWVMAISGLVACQMDRKNRQYREWKIKQQKETKRKKWTKKENEKKRQREKNEIVKNKNERQIEIDNN